MGCRFAPTPFGLKSSTGEYRGGILSEAHSRGQEDPPAAYSVGACALHPAPVSLGVAPCREHAVGVSADPGLHLPVGGWQPIERADRRQAHPELAARTGRPPELS